MTLTPVAVNVDAFDSMGNAVAFSHTIFVTISDVPAETAPPAQGPEKPTAEPVVYISKCVTIPETVVAGEEFALTLTLKKYRDHKNRPKSDGHGGYGEPAD